MNLDRVQRLVVRMTIDPDFAGQVLGGLEPTIDASTLAALRAVDANAWGAERGRAEQMLGNLAGEFPLAVRLAAPGVLEGFVRSPEFHRAIESDSSLPLALGLRLLAAAGPSARAVTQLEVEMARARRLAGPRAEAPIRLAAGVRLVLLPAGTVAWAAEAGVAGRPPPSSTGATECALLAPRGGGRWNLPDVRVEVVSGAVARLLELAAIGMVAADIVAFGVECDASVEEVRGLLADLCADGILDPAAVDV